MNQDFVLKVERRPNPGETITNAELSTHNGGKGANPAAAATFLGASVASLRVVRGGSQCPGKGDIDTTLIPPGTPYKSEITKQSELGFSAVLRRGVSEVHFERTTL